MLFRSPPRGLYASWNFGLAQLHSAHAYISTVGDAITPEGLRHLFRVMRETQSDVVLSPPAFVAESGRHLPDKRWTIHRFVEEHNIRQPALVPRAHFFLTSVFAAMSGFMGSSASNLYRTETMQQLPFPTEFGHVGDTAWGVANAFAARVAVTPQVCARFQIHLNAGNLSAAAEIETEQKLMQLARETWQRARDSGSVPATAQDMTTIMDQYESERSRLRAAEADYARGRASLIPWPLNPAAWLARRRRRRYRAAIHALWWDSLARFSF